MKQLMSLVLVSMLVFVLAGCGQEAVSSTASGNEDVGKQTVPSSEEEGVKIASMLYSYLFGSFEKGVSEDTISQFFCAVFSAGTEEAKNSIRLFIKDLDEKAPDVVEVTSKEFGLQVSKEYVDLVANEIFGMTLDQEAQNGMYSFGLGDPPLVSTAQDTFIDKGNGLYEVTIKTYDFAACEVDGAEEMLENVPYGQLKEEYKALVNSLFTVSYECIDGNIRILDFSNEAL